VITGNFRNVPIIDQNASIVPKDVEVQSDGTLKLFDSAGELLNVPDFTNLLGHNLVSIFLLNYLLQL
jgi:hypothetical protein